MNPSSFSSSKTVISKSEKIQFLSTGNGFLSQSSSSICSENPSGDKFCSLIDVANILAYDGVSLASVVNGIPEVDHDELSEHLVKFLSIACETVPVEASRIMSSMLLLELERATRRRNDVHTFMRGNGVVTKVFESLIAKASSLKGGLEEQLVKCCSDLCIIDNSLILSSSSILKNEYNNNNNNLAKNSSPLLSFEENFKIHDKNYNKVSPPVLFLLEGLDYFNNETDLQLNSKNEILQNPEGYALAIIAMSHSILNVVCTSVSQWPWSLRKSLRTLLESLNTESKKNLELIGENDNLIPLNPLGQNMMATIVVLRGLVPALLTIVSHLLPEESCFDKHYILVQKRCTMLAKLAQKAAHGLLFNGPHEKLMSVFNIELPALTKRWSNIFAQICPDLKSPIPRQSNNILKHGSEITLYFCEFLDHHLPRLIHASMQFKPIMEPIYWIRLLQLTKYAERRLAHFGHFAIYSNISDIIINPTPSKSTSSTNILSSESSIFSRKPRQVLGLLSRLGYPQLPTEGIQIENKVKTNLQYDEIFKELISYALNVTINPEITGLHVSFCGILGIAFDGSVTIFLHWGLMRMYLDHYHNKIKTEFKKRCPLFYRHKRHSNQRDGDSLAFLFLLIDIAVTTKESEGFRLIIIGGKSSSSCQSWLLDSLRLIPSKYASRCLHILLFLSNPELQILNKEKYNPFNVTIIRRATDLLTALEEMRLRMPLGCTEYHILVEELMKEDKNYEKSLERLFPPITDIIIPSTSNNNNNNNNSHPAWTAPKLNCFLEAQEAHLWPVSLMRDILEVIYTAINSPNTIPHIQSSISTITDNYTENTINNIFTRPIYGVPLSIMTNFRMKAVEFFFNFEGDLLLHLEINPKWLSNTIKHKGDVPSFLNNRIHQQENLYRCSWFTTSHAKQNDIETHESSMLLLLFLATNRFYTTGGHPNINNNSSSTNANINLREGWPIIVPSLRHITLDSLWKLLLYNLWNTFALVRQISPLKCPVTLMTESLRKYLEEIRLKNIKLEYHDFLCKDINLLNTVASALATTPVVECELIQLLVGICNFVRMIDFKELDLIVNENGNNSNVREEALTDGVIRIMFRKERIDDAELIIAQLIASQGNKLLEAAHLPSWNSRLWLPHATFARSL